MGLSGALLSGMSLVAVAGAQDEAVVTPGVEPCAQVLTTAHLPGSGECRVFPTPCAVPHGWVAGCAAAKVHKQERRAKPAKARNKLRELPKHMTGDRGHEGS